MRQFFIINEQNRERIAQVIRSTAEGMCVRVSEPTRSLEQNARMWALLEDVSRQVDWYGQKLTNYEWKDVFSASLKKQKAVPGIDGGFVICGQSTSQMTKSELSDLMMVIEAFGAERNVKWSA